MEFIRLRAKYPYVVRGRGRSSSNIWMPGPGHTGQGSLVPRRLRMVGFEEVKLEEALSDPSSFYAQYARIKPANRRLLLVRLPRDFDLHSLEGEEVPFLAAPGANSLGDGQHTLRAPETHTATATLALAVPGNRALLVQPLDGPTWTVTRKGDQLSAQGGGEVDFDKDLDARAGPPPMASRQRQPGGLHMNLSAVDISTVINRKRRRVKRVK